MKHLSIITTFILLVTASVFSQSSDYQKYHIKNVGIVSISNKMEIQSGNYKKLSEEIQNKLAERYDYEVSDDRIVFQQKGLNDFDTIGFKNYARIIIETSYGNIGDFEKLNFDINQFSNSDIIELNNIFKQQIRQRFEGTSMKLITWYPVTVEKLNGMSCVHINYKRQSNQNPYVLVNMYIFQNSDRMHTLTLSYRVTEESFWKNDFVKVLKSFKISNVR